MQRTLYAVVIISAIVAGCSTTPKPLDLLAAKHSSLTDDQVVKYLHSYAPAHTMARKYWGKRRFTPANNMLPPRGTFGRAIKEMDNAGILPDFERLLQGYGFDGHETWLRVGQRVSFAYITLRNEKRDPVRAQFSRQDREEQWQALIERRKKVEQLPIGRRKRQLSMLDVMQKQVERDLIVELDKDALRPHMAEFEALDRKIIAREK